MKQAGILREVRWREQLPEPGLMWIRWFPRPWRGPDSGVWTDLARAGLGWGRGAEGRESLPRPDSRCFEDLVYLPPGTAGERAERIELATDLASRGTPVLLQAVPGDEPLDLPGVQVLYDLMPVLWHRDPAALEALPAGSSAVWPLIPGVTDGDRLIEAGIERLRGAGVGTVIGVDLELSPGDRREVVGSHGDQLFDLLFHRQSSSERRLARLVAGAGFQWWLDRPLPLPPMLKVGNRRLAGLLLVIADLWSRLGRPPEQGQAFYRAARWIDDSHYHVEALVREGNLDVVATIDAASHSVVTDYLARGSSSTLDELRAEWIAGQGTNEI